MDIAKRILDLCDHFNISPNKLADSTGVPRSTLNDIITRRNKNPGVHTIEKLCEGVRITLADFFAEDKFPDLPIEAIQEIKAFEEYIYFKYKTLK